MRFKKLLAPAAAVLVGIPAVSSANVNIKGVDIAAGQAVVKLESDRETTGYITVIEGANKSCGSINHITAGQNGRREPAYRKGSLPFQANTIASYAVTNLAHESPYTLCATDGINYKRYSFTTSSMADYPAAAWQMQTNGKPRHLRQFSFSVSPDGTSYVAGIFHEIKNPNIIITGQLWKIEDDDWKAVGVPFGNSTGDYGSDHIALAFSRNGTPYVSHWRGRNEIIVQKLQGEEWVQVGNIIHHDNNATPMNQLLGFTSDGVPYFSFVASPTSSSNDEVVVMKLEENQWNFVGNASSIGSAKTRQSMAIGKDDAVYVAYGDSYNRLKVKKFNGVLWEDLTETDNISSLYDPKLSFAPDGTLYVAHGSAEVKKRVGNAWVAVGQATVKPYHYAMAVAPDGAPYVVYRQQATVPGEKTRLAAKKFNGMDWEPVTIPAAAEGIQSPSIREFVFSPDGTPYVGVNSCADINESHPSITYFPSVFRLYNKPD